MLPANDPTPPRLRLLLGALLVGTMLASAGPSARGADDARTDSAVGKVPADVAFFGSMLRNKEQIDLFLKSNAYKTLRALPIVKKAVAEFRKNAKLDEKDGPMAHYRAFVKDKANQALVELILEAGSDEIFVYGGKAWNNFLTLAGRVNNAQSWAPLQAAISGGNPQTAQARAMLLALQKDRAMLQIPDLVIGFKIKDGGKGEAQLKRLDRILGGLMEVAPAQIKEKAKVDTVKIGTGTFVTVETSGAAIPWDDVPLKDFEEKKDEFEELIKHAKKMTLALSVGVKDGYLLVALTSSVKELEKFGGKDSLATREEMAPLAKVASKPLVNIGYSSKALALAAAGTQMDLDGMARMLKDAVAKSDPIKEARKKAIDKDIDRLIGEMKKEQPKLGASVGFSYMTSTGYEAYGYNYGDHSSLEGVTTSLPEHFGGTPIFAAAFGCKTTGEGYAWLSRWIQTVYGHAEGVFLDNAPQEAQDVYQKVSKALNPVWKRIDEITRTQFLPSIKDSGLGLVLDAKWTSKQWHQMAPGTDKPVPMPELGLLLGISDARAFEKAMTEYRKVLNELYEKVREAAPDKENIPAFKIPAPNVDKGKYGNLIYYPLPAEVGLDKQVQPMTAIGKNVSVLTFSREHAERLLASTPVKIKDVPSPTRKNLWGVAVLNWPGLVDAAAPWVDMGVRQAPVPDFKPDEVAKQVGVILDVFRCYRGMVSETYVEETRLVTRIQKIMKDLESAP